MQAVRLGLVPHALVAQMAKHKGLTELMPEVTVSYIGDRRLIAMTNQSARAVRLLDIGKPSMRHACGPTMLDARPEESDFLDSEEV